MLKKIKEVAKKTIKYVKKGVKWVMEKKNELIDNSLAVRVYENTREDVKEVLSNDNNKIAIGLGLGVLFIVSGLLNKFSDSKKEEKYYVEEDQ